MAIRYQSRFCGIVIKSGERVQWTPPPALSYSSNPSPGVFIFSSEKEAGSILFDGYIYNAESFSRHDIREYIGGWAAGVFENNALHLSRDAVGVRAIYYIETPSFFCFSNEVKHLLELRMLPVAFSKSAIFKFLFFDEVEADDDGMFEGVKELLPGHCLTLDRMTMEKTIFSFYEKKQPKSYLEKEEEVGEYIKNTLTQRTHNILSEDSATGAFLSGGIDSSAIAASLFLKDHLTIPFITAVTTDDSLNETLYAASVVKQFNLSNWHQVEVSGIEDELENLHYIMEFPTLSSGSFMQYELFRFARFLNLHQVFDGTGADALYAGHLYYKPIYWNSLMKSGKWRKLSKELKKNRGGKEFWLTFYLRMMAKYKIFGFLGSGLKQKVLLRQNALLKNINPQFLSDHRAEFENRNSRDMKDLNKFLEDDFFGGNVKRLLRFPDRIGKHFQVMNLSLFSDSKDLFEQALSIAPQLKIKNDQLKYILRYAFKNELPVEILNRDDKMGLVAPNNLWLKEHKSIFLSYFDESLSPYFEVEQMKNALSTAIEHTGKQEDYKIFKFISFAIWHKVFSEKYKQ